MGFLCHDCGKVYLYKVPYLFWDFRLLKRVIVCVKKEFIAGV